MRRMVPRLTSGAMNAGLLPVKRLDAAKSRLDGVFDARQRFQLASALLEDALDLAKATELLEWFVLTADADVARRARARGFHVISDPPDADLNRSLKHAIDLVGRRGAGSVTIVPVDAPLVTPEELVDLLDTGSTSDIVVVPAERDAGTNGLFLTPVDVIEPRFGESSFSGYVREAEGAKLRCSILPLEGLAIDVDTVEDVEALLERAKHHRRSIALLRGWWKA